MFSLFCTAGAAACQTRERRVVDTAGQREWLLRVQRDSSVIDSLSRLVNTDSLYRLNEAMRTARDPRPLVHEAACERARLQNRHGLRPTTLAVRRMADTLWRPDKRRIEREIESRMPQADMITVSAKLCGYGDPAPDSVAGVSLRFPPAKRVARPQQ
jgi:hypothetical protein